MGYRLGRLSKKDKLKREQDMATLESLARVSSGAFKDWPMFGTKENREHLRRLLRRHGFPLIMAADAGTIMGLCIEHVTSNRFKDAYTGVLDLRKSPVAVFAELAGLTPDYLATETAGSLEVMRIDLLDRINDIIMSISTMVTGLTDRKCNVLAAHVEECGEQIKKFGYTDSCV